MLNYTLLTDEELDALPDQTILAQVWGAVYNNPKPYILEKNEGLWYEVDVAGTADPYHSLNTNKAKYAIVYKPRVG